MVSSIIKRPSHTVISRLIQDSAHFMNFKKVIYSYLAKQSMFNIEISFALTRLSRSSLLYLNMQILAKVNLFAKRKTSLGFLEAVMSGYCHTMGGHVLSSKALRFKYRLPIEITKRLKAEALNFATSGPHLLTNISRLFFKFEQILRAFFTNLGQEVRRILKV